MIRRLEYLTRYYVACVLAATGLALSFLSEWLIRLAAWLGDVDLETE